MSDHQSETAFLRHCDSYDASPERQELEARIAQIQRDEHCVQRAVWLMALLLALSATALGYGAALGDNFPYNTPQLVTNTICALGVGSLISLLVFAVFGITCRKKLDRRREECRLLVAGRLESRRRQLVVAPSSEVANETGSIVPQAGLDRSASQTNQSRA